MTPCFLLHSFITPNSPSDGPISAAKAISTPCNDLLGTILFLRWYAFATTPFFNVPYRVGTEASYAFAHDIFGIECDSSETWLRHLKDALFNIGNVQEKMNSAKIAIKQQLAGMPVGATINNNDNYIQINAYGQPDSILTFVMGGMELYYTATKKSYGIEIRWKIFDELDAKSFTESVNDKQLHSDVSHKAWLAGMLEGMVDIVGDKIGQTWYSLTVYQDELIGHY